MLHVDGLADCGRRPAPPPRPDRGSRSCDARRRRLRPRRGADRPAGAVGRPRRRPVEPAGVRRGVGDEPHRSWPSSRRGALRPARGAGLAVPRRRTTLVESGSLPAGALLVVAHGASGVARAGRRRSRPVRRRRPRPPAPGRLHRRRPRRGRRGHRDRAARSCWLPDDAVATRRRCGHRRRPRRQPRTSPRFRDDDPSGRPVRVDDGHASRSALWRDDRPPGRHTPRIGVGPRRPPSGRRQGPTALRRDAICAAGRQLRTTAADIADLLERRRPRRAPDALCQRSSDGTPAGSIASGIAAAAIESVAENMVDAVFAPAFWALVAGAPGAAAHRALNTMDAMVGRRNARYEHFGWAAARADDVANLVPARLFAALLLVSRVPIAPAIIAAVRVGRRRPSVAQRRRGRGRHGRRPRLRARRSAPLRRHRWRTGRAWAGPRPDPDDLERRSTSPTRTERSLIGRSARDSRSSQTLRLSEATMHLVMPPAWPPRWRRRPARRRPRASRSATSSTSRRRSTRWRPTAGPVLAAHLDALGRYPDDSRRHRALAEAMDVDADRLVLTNGGAEAIAARRPAPADRLGRRVRLLALPPAPQPRSTPPGRGGGPTPTTPPAPRRPPTTGPPSATRRSTCWPPGAGPGATPTPRSSVRSPRRGRSPACASATSWPRYADEADDDPPASGPAGRSTAWCARRSLPCSTWPTRAVARRDRRAPQRASSTCWLDHGLARRAERRQLRLGPRGRRPARAPAPPRHPRPRRRQLRPPDAVRVAVPTDRRSRTPRRCLAHPTPRRTDA